MDNIREYVLDRIQQEYVFEEGIDVDYINYVENGYVTSLGLIQFIVELEEKFKIRFTTEEMSSNEFCTVKGLTDIIKKKMGSV